MDDPIDRLLAEHREIMAEVETLRRAVDDLHAQGSAALPGAVPALASVGRMMATRLLRHARKEDEALFPALERAFGAPEGGSSEGPTAVMREEHRVIHDRARAFRETLHRLNEVEHPAIIAGGARLRALAQGGADAATLAETGEAIVSLLDLHFGKEEQILFPMAREALSRETLRAVAERMDAIEAEVA
jgi:iron-sulfur cluster repair protein YtfE (RIC family)